MVMRRNFIGRGGLGGALAIYRIWAPKSKGAPLELVPYSYLVGTLGTIGTHFF